MKKKLLITFTVLLSLCGSNFAQGYESHWPDFNSNAYENQGTFVAAISVNGTIIDATYTGWDAFELGFFVGDECRGNNSYLYNGYVEEYGDPFPIIDGVPVYYDNPGETVTVSVYDHLNGVLYENCPVTYLGEPFTVLTGDDNMQGWFDPENPIILYLTNAQSWSNGVLPGEFSVSATQQVHFSQGNLQYQASTGTWKFAEHQYEYVGSGNSNISQDYDGWIDLFGWGTSGWNSGNTYYHPWDSDDSDGSLYGPIGDYDLTGDYANADWGVYNAISNGGNLSGLWRTLSSEEWAYIVRYRTTNSGIRYAMANVNGINGVILLPDNWDVSNYTLNETNNYEANFDSNIISATAWLDLEQQGVVFLPAAGNRFGNRISNVEFSGEYWSVSYDDSFESHGAIHLLCEDGFFAFFPSTRKSGQSVRLARSVQSPYMGVIHATPNPTDGGTVSGAGSYELGTECTLIATANTGYAFFNWSKDNVEVSTNPTYTFTVSEDASYVANFTQNTNATSHDTLFRQYNWWSTYLDITLNDLQAALLGPVSIGTTICSQTGHTTYNGIRWRGNLTSINNESSYKIYIPTESQITIPLNLTGSMVVPSEHPITLNQGWTWIGYPLSHELNINEALSGFTPSAYDVIKGQECFAFYHPTAGWCGSLRKLTPGMGLMYLSSANNNTLVYPDGPGTLPLENNITATNNHWEPYVNYSLDNMNIVGVMKLNGVEIRSEQYEIAAFDNYRCLGSSRLIYFEPEDRYYAFLTFCGYEDDEIIFKVYDHNIGQELDVSIPTITFEANGVLGLPIDNPYYFNFNSGQPIDTTIYAEICYGDDYLTNDIEIIQPELGEYQYSITLQTPQGFDSIVNLTLNVYPNYNITIDTLLCDQTSFQWHGHTYTESGTYYDTLQTIHGCDSIYALSLEFFNTPLGEFASMIPTNNYPFTSLPITFSWDAVSGAEYYNLYLWNVNEPVPSTPFAGNIYNRSCYVPSLQNHQNYNWYVEAVNTCFSTTSSVRSFSLNIPPNMNVSASNLNFGEVALNNSNSLNLYVSGNALDDTITMQISGEDASMFSFEQGSNWNGLTGGSLSVTFSPTTVKYNYTASLVITTGTLTQTVQLTGSLADMFVFNTFVTQDVFEMNSTVPIYGTVMDLNNNPASSAEVEVKVTVMNMTRSLFATTGADGHFSVDFVPAYSESGYYTINSGRVGHNSTAVHDDFNIPGMNLITNDWILWDVVQNETSTGSIVIRNRSQIPLNNIQVTANTLPEGCSFTFQPLSLAGMEEGVLEYSVSGTTPTNGYQEVALVATSSEGASMNFTVWYRCAEPRGILYAAPNNITTTMTKGINKIVDVMLYNNGTGPTGSVYLDLPSVDWLSVVGNDTLPSIAVHDSAYFSLRLSANETTPLVQYTGNIAINCERGDGLSLPYTIMAVSDSTGTLVVDVTDDYTYNGNGQHLQGATVTVKGYYSLETVAVGLTDSNGLFTVSDIPEGYYRMSVRAPHHANYDAVIQIEGGQTNTQNIYLQYQAITYSWNVVPTEIQDEYTFELIVEYETNVPVPVVVIDMPQTFPELAEGESFVFDYIITNYGLVDTYDATLYPPTDHPLYDFTPLITEIDTLHAQSTVVIPCTMTVRTGLRSQAIIEALGGNGNREETDCPYSALTKTKQYYMCGDQQNWFWANVWRNIGSTPCQTAPATVSSGGGGPSGGGGGYGGGGSSSSSSTPAVTVQNNDCDFDPCLSGVKDDIDNCNNNGSGTPPALPPQNPANNR